MQIMKVVMLTGGMRPSPLRVVADRPVASLPLTRHVSLFGAWLQVLEALDCPVDLTIATNLDDDIPALRRLVLEQASRTEWLRSARVARDPHDWRGSGGVLRDLAGDALDSDDMALVLEGGCLPPLTLEPLVQGLQDGAALVVGATEDLVPAGAMGCRMAVLREVPEVGYCDLKEQVIPRLTQGGGDVRAACVSDELVRLRDHASYLHAVSIMSRRVSDPLPEQPWTEVGACLVESGASVDLGAILKDTVVLNGASVGAAAVLNGCLVSAGGIVEAGQRVADRVIIPNSDSVPRRTRRDRSSSPVREGAAA